MQIKAIIPHPQHFTLLKRYQKSLNTYKTYNNLLLPLFYLIIYIGYSTTQYLLSYYSLLCNFNQKSFVILQKLSTIELYLNTITCINLTIYLLPSIRLANHSSFVFALAWVLFVSIHFHPSLA